MYTGRHEHHLSISAALRFGQEHYGRTGARILRDTLRSLRTVRLGVHRAGEYTAGSYVTVRHRNFVQRLLGRPAREVTHSLTRPQSEPPLSQAEVSLRSRTNVLRVTGKLRCSTENRQAGNRQTQKQSNTPKPTRPQNKHKTHPKTPPTAKSPRPNPSHTETLSKPRNF